VADIAPVEPTTLEATILDRRRQPKPDWGVCRMTGCDLPAAHQVTVDYTSRLAGKAYARRDVIAVCSRCQYLMSRDIVASVSIGFTPPGELNA
jgi:hypothetical protein